jgi:acyl-coenzyme A synthetase/AMP-(fatty) acid ligase/acyl carrier protein
MSEHLQIDRHGPTDQPFELFPEAALQAGILERFDRIARRFSGRLAVRDCSNSLTYAELAAIAGAMAAAIMRAAAGRAGPVAILLDSEASYPAAMLAVLAAGRAYVPLDSGAPAERNRTIASEAAVCAIVSAGNLLADALALAGPGVSIVDLGRIGPDRESSCSTRSNSDDLAFIMYTSGSTGTSKGIAFSHRNILQNVLQYTNSIHLSHDDRLILARSFSVHGSVRTIYGALLNGASLHILPPRQLGAAGLAKEIRAHGITVYFSAVTLLRRIAEALAPGERLDTIRVATIGSERVDWRDVDLCRRHFSDRVHVQTGLLSTESSGGICQWFVDDSVRASSRRLPVGYALHDRRIAIVGEDGQPVTDGEAGEIVVSTPHVALGHWHPDGTIRSFPADPADPDRKLLVTGDFGLRRADGLIEFIGRRDSLIKLHGQRIDCTEVEAVLAGLRQVRETAVVVRKDQSGTPRMIVGFVVLQPGNAGLLGRHLQAMLAQTLPPYMVPGRIVVIGQMPLLASMKIDRIGLGDLDAAQMPEAGNRAHDPLLDRIARVFETTLDIAGASAEDNVASLGGDSIQAISVMTEIERQFSVAVPDSLLAGNPTIGMIAEWLRASGIGATAETSIDPAS